MSSREHVRADLLSSMASMLSGSTNPLLLAALKAAFPWLSFALIVNWIPEQAEDIFWVLIDLDRIATVEVSRLSSDLAGVSVEVLDLNKYKERRLSIESRRKLEVAIDLMRENYAS
ncbi:hypothetical protein HBH25_13975 [Pseudomonas sp. hsmgli-8]|uniref:Uncharacterized protein n=2 Tax=Pseudomonas TaxID=286 RepID=A0ABX0YF21_9PSED|nr:hypothetical protein [Pseudomonas quercus]